MGLKDRIEAGGVQDVALFQRPPLHGGGAALGEIVEDDGRMPCGRERLAGMAADIAGASRHQYPHANSLTPEA